MNDATPRCAVPGSSCRLLHLDTPGTRPVWAVLDAAGTRHFTGEITLHVDPSVRAWFQGGELYYAERDGDPSVAERLRAMDVLSDDDLSAGSVRLGEVVHLGRLFDRVPHLDRDRVELALEILTGEVVGEIADHLVEEITVASYRHHASGVVRWQKRPAVAVAAPADPAEPIEQVEQVEQIEDPADREIVAAWKASQVLGVLGVPAEPVAVAPVPEPVMARPVMARPVAEPVVIDAAVIEPATASVAPAETLVSEPTATPAFAAFAAPADQPAPLDILDAATATPVFAAPAFELSVADILAELSAELGTELGTGPGAEPGSVGSISDSISAPAFTAASTPTSAPVLQPALVAVLAMDAATSTVTEPEVVSATALAPDAHPDAPASDPAWQIDDRIDWQVDPPAHDPVHLDPADPDPVGHGTTADDPVVQLDLEQVLSRAPLQAFGLDDAAAVAPDDEIQAAVQAALAGIAAATRTGGDHETPSSLLQAALGDLEPHADPLRAVAAADPVVSGDVTAPLDTIAPVVLRPILPTRPGTTASPASEATGTAAADPAGAGTEGRPTGTPASTGGLRRLLGTRKP
ncbi:MAG: hypothetical protein F2534_17430 [Actinobacteria bacterium]|uniref:Unannotated protein n=1 Tax=freshwater metagenome TaxID=449393 RepID=A0A6J6FMC5_9ZZZZ|nr:hypothetical protein [Actinomycetota bacterium]